MGRSAREAWERWFAPGRRDAWLVQATLRLIASSPPKVRPVAWRYDMYYVPYGLSRPQRLLKRLRDAIAPVLKS